jgi:hypothetical protein
MTDNGSDHKQQQLEGYRVDRATGYLTTQQGVRVDHTDDSLTAGERCPAHGSARPTRSRPDRLRRLSPSGLY